MVALADVTREFIARQNERVIDELRFLREQNGPSRSDLGEIKERMCMLEAQYASVSRRVDLVSGRLDRIERRLDLVEA